MLFAFMSSPRLDELTGANKTIKVTYGVFKGAPVLLYLSVVPYEHGIIKTVQPKCRDK